MKKVFLCFLLLLTGCAGSTGLCNKYQYTSQQEKTTLFVQKNGYIEKETQKNNLFTAQKGLYTLQEDTLSVYIQNQTDEYKLLNNNKTLFNPKTKKHLICE